MTLRTLWRLTRRLDRDHLVELNYAITLYTHEEFERASEHFAEFERIFGDLDQETKESDPDVLEQRALLAKCLTAISNGENPGHAPIEAAK